MHWMAEYPHISSIYGIIHYENMKTTIVINIDKKMVEHL